MEDDEGLLELNASLAGENGGAGGAGGVYDEFDVVVLVSGRGGRGCCRYVRGLEN